MNTAFNEFLHQTVLQIADAVPEIPTHMGVFEIGNMPVPQDRFTDMSAEGVQARRQMLDQLAAELKAFPRDSLDDDERISAAVLEYMLENVYERGLVGRASHDLADHDYALRPAVGPQSELPMFLAELHPMRGEADAEAYLSRLKCIAPQLTEAGRQLAGRQTFLPPECVIADTIEEIDQFLSIEPGKNVLLFSLEQKTADMHGLDEAGRNTLLREAERELVRSTYPAYRELRDTLAQLHTDAPGGPGLWCLPNGSDWYRFLLRGSTTTALSPEEIHETGLEQMASVKARIREECRQAGLDVSDMASVASALQSRHSNSSQDTPENREAIVQAIRDLIAEAESWSTGLFHEFPRGKVEVRTIAPFAEKQRNQGYQPPSLDGSRPGFFELNLGQLLDHSIADLPILVYHEIFPGHHLQITLALENERLPMLRRYMNTDAYIEGWAKYAETIPERHGFVSDPLFRIERMRRELISTVNLALDTGIHDKRWDEDAAVDFCMKNSGCSANFARYLVHRSASVPAQMCSYKIGMMTMENLRNRFENALGGRFDVRDFHSTVLDC
ncbi:MAG: DUF885 domain-containing protein, partial [Xanthomonadales bacterium]|nr:DUF885 domain-containing protein [Xanthomonadales bacterium]